jgi:radical SAM protein with 4Fe4S-binding SPASM domain
MQQTKLNGFPDVIRIEPVGICNFKCIHCPTGTQPNQRRLLKANQFSKIVSQFNDRRFIPRVVVLYHAGEPLLNKKISDYVHILKEIGVTKVHIVTNGSLLTKQVSEKLIMAGLDEIHISFDGESADENNIIRKNGDFYKDAANLKEFYRLYKEIGFKKIRILISNVQVMNKVDSDINQNDRLVTPSYLTEYFCNECPEIEFQSVPAMVWPGFLAFGKFQVAALPKQTPNYCGSLFETITILANGDVVPCCYDLPGEVVFGNVFESNIFDIWDNLKYREFRKDFRKQIYASLCRKCNVISPQYLCKNSV